MSDEKKTYTIVFPSMGCAFKVELTEDDFRAKCSKTIRDFIASGRTEERTRELLEFRKTYAQQLEGEDGEDLSDPAFENECIRQLDTGEWKITVH